MNKLATFALVSIFVMALSISCMHSKTKFNQGELVGSSETAGKGGVIVQVEWVKKKPSSIDLQIYITNNYQHPITIKDSAYQLSYNGIKVSLKNTGSTTEMMAGIRAKKLLIFPIDTVRGVASTAILIIDPIYNSSEGAEKLKVVSPFNLNIPIVAQ